MKKLFFTAIALVAFSVASFAEVKPQSQNFIKVDITVKSPPPFFNNCMVRAFKIMAGLNADLGMTDAEYTENWLVLYNECMACQC